LLSRYVRNVVSAIDRCLCRVFGHYWSMGTMNRMCLDCSKEEFLQPDGRYLDAGPFWTEDTPPVSRLQNFRRCVCRI
jgi:hypothetical protein